MRSLNRRSILGGASASPFIAALLAPVCATEGPTIGADKTKAAWHAACTAYHEAERAVELERARFRLGLRTYIESAPFEAQARAADRLIRAAIPVGSRSQHLACLTRKSLARRWNENRARNAHGGAFVNDWDEIIAADKAATPAPRPKGARHG